MPQLITSPRSGAQDRPHDGRIAGAVVGDTHERFNDAAALNFVVVLPNDPLFAGHIQDPRICQQSPRC